MGEKLEKILNRLVAEMQQDDIELSYNVNLYASRRGMNATVQLQLREKKNDGRHGKYIPRNPKTFLMWGK